MNNKTKILLLMPFILCVLSVLAAKSIPFDQSFSGSESQVLDFISTELNISDTGKTQIVTNLKGPFKFSRKSKDIPNDKVADIDYNDNSLSLTVIGSRAKMAIINGQLVKEGDTFQGMKIKKIEPERVLIKNKTTEWLYLEKTQ